MWTLIFVFDTSVLWHHGPSGYPSVLHRDRSTKGHRQSSASIPPPLIILSNAFYGTSSSPRSSVSQSCERFVCFASFVRSVTTAPFCCTSPFFWCLFCLLMRNRVSSVRSRSCTSLSDVRRTRSWRSDSLYSWSSSYLAPFCARASFSRYIPLAHLKHVKVFYRARYVGRHPRNLHQLGWRSITVCS